VLHVPHTWTGRGTHLCLCLKAPFQPIILDERLKVVDSLEKNVPSKSQHGTITQATSP
jgi:hypothetical protein